MMKFLRNKFIAGLFAAAIVALILSSLYVFGIFELWEVKASDYYFSERKGLDNIVIISIDDKSLQTIGRWPWKREIYLENMNKLRSAKVIGFDVAFYEKYDAEIDNALGKLFKENLSIVLPVEYSKFEIRKDYKTPYGIDILTPIDSFSEIDVGYVNIIIDEDGVAREIPIEISGVNNHKSLGAKVSEKFLGSLSVEDNNLRINYAGGPKSFKTISFADFAEMKEEDALDFFKNKIVFVGATAPDLHDDALTPTSHGRKMAGVEINANIANTLITKDYLKRQSLLSAIAVIILLTLLVGFIAGKFRLLYATAGIVLIYALYVIAITVFFNKGIIINIIYPTLSVVLTYFSLLGVLYVTEGKEKRRIKSLFSKYVSKHIVDEILSKTTSDVIDLRGEEKEITVLFADIRGFTSISEKMNPRDVVEMLNLYLGEMVNIVFKHNGTLDKYIGDCVMAIYGAPLKDSDHALNAVRSALEMHEVISKTYELHGKTLPKVQVGIGINTGNAVVGNIGSSIRAEYTAIGDAVNTASRMCSAAEAGQIIITKDTYELVKDCVEVEKLPPVKAKGKKKLVEVYLVKKIM